MMIGFVVFIAYWYGGCNQYLQTELVDSEGASQQPDPESQRQSEPAGSLQQSGLNTCIHAGDSSTPIGSTQDQSGPDNTGTVHSQAHPETLHIGDKEPEAQGAEGVADRESSEEVTLSVEPSASETCEDEADWADRSMTSTAAAVGHGAKAGLHTSLLACITDEQMNHEAEVHANEKLPDPLVMPRTNPDHRDRCCGGVC